MNRVQLNLEEAEWFSRNVKKMLQLLEMSEKKNEGVRGRSTYRTLKSMEKVAHQIDESGAPDTIDIMLSKRQKVFTRGLIQSVLKTLTEKVIPIYESRGESHREYLIKASIKADKLQTLARKFK